MVDGQTGPGWNERGETIAGPLAGTPAHLDSGLGEWYDFAANHPHTENFQAP
jgi:hypothetical protein